MAKIPRGKAATTAPAALPDAPASAAPAVAALRTLLHVGCGPKRKDRTTRGFNTDEWHEVRLDIDASVQPDVTGTMTDMSAVAAASVDAIFSSHNIEHLYPHEVPVALAEFLRVLQGTLQAAGFAMVATMARSQHFDLWAVASKAPRSEGEMRSLAAAHFPI
jgi:hypothetical protein